MPDDLALDQTRVEELRERLRQKDDGPWWVVVCSECGLLDHDSAYGSAERTGMQHVDEHVSDTRHHDISIDKIVDPTDGETSGVDQGDGL
ncbi:hypothetical protein [Halorhabdus rudnickae]|uniref:hypothetical protein n=1 Tax=Halorhabdus rudnickae TaxID=1775544 RepID=UPI001083A3F3|nr:hypothetical protein [Halorhabdus rudnickae]